MALSWNLFLFSSVFSLPCMNGIGELFFSFRGRIPRKVYWLAHLPIGMIMVGAGVYEGMKNDSIFASVVCLILLWPALAVQTKRWHDRGVSGWWNLLSFVPIMNIWAFIECGFLQGTKGSNLFGKDPLRKSNASHQFRSGHHRSQSHQEAIFLVKRWAAEKQFQVISIHESRLGRQWKTDQSCRFFHVHLQDSAGLRKEYWLRCPDSAANTAAIEVTGMQDVEHSL
jgi:uncharacterized membrane protein YhaH (DUF805 family)